MRGILIGISKGKPTLLEIEKDEVVSAIDFLKILVNNLGAIQ
jgi:hypothetical protein